MVLYGFLWTPLEVHNAKLMNKLHLKQVEWTFASYLASIGKEISCDISTDQVPKHQDECAPVEMECYYGGTISMAAEMQCILHKANELPLEWTSPKFSANIDNANISMEEEIILSMQ